MSRVRIVLAEIDGSDAAVQAAINSFIGRFGAQDAGGADRVEAIAASVITPAIEAPAAPAPVKQRRTSGKEIAEKSQSSAAAAPAADSRLSPCEEKLLAILAKGPRSSADLVRDSGYTSGTVYPALKHLRDLGRVSTGADADNPYPVNRLVK